MDSQAAVYVAGGTTVAGAALRRRLAARGAWLVGDPADEPDYSNREEVRQFFARVQPAYVYVTAGKSAGIAGNQRVPADLMRDNLDVAAHLLPAAVEAGVRKLLYLATSCVYPKHAPQPILI